MSTLNKIGLWIIVLVFAASLVSCQSQTVATTAGTGAQLTSVRVIIWGDPTDFEYLVKEFEMANPDIKINMTYVDDYEQLHEMFVTGMAASPPAYDVIQLDNPWYDEFIEAGYLADVSDRITAEEKQNILPAAWNMVTRDGKVYGMPWYLDTKYLFYNTDLLKQAGFDHPPATWEELVNQAQAIKDKGLVEYPIVWSWAQSEAALCDFTSLLYGNGGEFLDSAGKPVFNNDKGVQVLNWMKKTIDQGLSNPASRSYEMGEVIETMMYGKAAFSLNWLIAYEASNYLDESQVKGKIGITTVPVFDSMKGTLKSASVSGSQGFSITAASPNIDAAWKYLEFLASEPVRSKYFPYQMPVWSTAYQGDNRSKLENATKGAMVTVPAFEEQIKYTFSRPNIPYYSEGSPALQLALQQALTEQSTPQEALDAAAARWTELASQ